MPELAPPPPPPGRSAKGIWGFAVLWGIPAVVFLPGGFSGGSPTPWQVLHCRRFFLGGSLVYFGVPVGGGLLWSEKGPTTRFAPQRGFGVPPPPPRRVCRVPGEDFGVPHRVLPYPPQRGFWGPWCILGSTGGGLASWKSFWDLPSWQALPHKGFLGSPGVFWGSPKQCLVP